MRQPARILFALACLLTARTVRAQETPELRGVNTSRWFAGVGYGFQSFFGDIDPWQVGSISVGRKSTAGTVIGRANYAHRYGADGAQGEIDAYPRLGDGVYAYVNLGYSQSDVFPEWRSGAEIFTNLPGAYEASVGYRQLRFAESTPVTLFTGAVGKYQGNYWFSLRPYVRSKATGTSASASIQMRRYYEDGDHFLGARVGFGSTPSDELNLDQIVRTNSITAGLQGAQHLSSSVLGAWTAVFEREELTPTRTRNSIALDFGARILF